MAPSRNRNRQRESAVDSARSSAGRRAPSDLQSKLAGPGLELARSALDQRRWKDAYAYAESSHALAPLAAETIMAEASFRQARREALGGDFIDAQRCAARALELQPRNATYQRQRHLIAAAADAVLRIGDEPLFADTRGMTSARWWEADLLGPLRGSDGSRETVRAPLMLEETARATVRDVYALGIYQPWHVSGPAPLFSRYIQAFKSGGQTISIAAILLRQGLIDETAWVEEIDAIVPMATSLRSYEARGFELTEQLADELGLRLCVPVIDVFEVDPDVRSTHQAGGYAERARALADALRVKRKRSAELEGTEAVLVVDDVVTYGSTFEACALALERQFGVTRTYGAALAYTETPQRRQRARAQRQDV